MQLYFKREEICQPMEKKERYNYTEEYNNR